LNETVITVDGFWHGNLDFERYVGPVFQSRCGVSQFAQQSSPLAIGGIIRTCGRVVVREMSFLRSMVGRTHARFLTRIGFWLPLFAIGAFEEIAREAQGHPVTLNWQNNRATSLGSNNRLRIPT
jgi:hypothetical protein